MQSHQEEVAWRAIKAAREDFLAFCLLTNPHFVVGPHHSLIAEKLNLVRLGKLRRLMIFLPPRSSKSFMTSHYYPAWCLGHAPKWEIIEVSHSKELAEGFSREIRNLITTDEYQAIFPGTALRPDSRAAGRWHTDQGGKFLAASTGSKIAGIGGHLILLDDPLSEQDAYSKAERTHVNTWYPGGLRSRLYPGGRVVLTNTRWHEDDLSGHLLRTARQNKRMDQWEVISIPAILDEETALLLEHHRNLLIKKGLLPEDYPHMQAGGSFWPRAPQGEDDGMSDGERLAGWSTEDLLNTKANLPDMQWAALYMQQPSAEEGNIIKRAHWMHWPENEAPPQCEFIIMTLDTAFSEKETADYSVIQLWGIFRDTQSGLPNLICLGNKRGHWAFDELITRTLSDYNEHRPDLVLIENKASGISLIQSLQARGIPVMPWPQDNRIKERDKHSRLWACTPLFSAGRIWIPPQFRWAEELISEAAAFPTASNDDQVDAMTMAVLWVKSSYMVNHPDDIWQNNRPTDTMEGGIRRRYYT